MYEIVTFFLCKGIPLDELLNATHAEKIMYSVAKEKYWTEEMEKYTTLLKIIFGEGKK